MTVSSMTQLVAGAVQQSLGQQNSRLAASISHLASGNRIMRAMEDIASLSMATSLQSQVTGLRAASTNISQASSMLQVADGAMGQIGSILDRMQALSVQAHSGALNDSARQGLNSEFQALADEIDRLAGNTNFNNVPLLDGSLANDNSITTNTSTGEQASGSLNFTAPIAGGDTVVLNGQTLTAGTDFAVGGTTDQTVANLADALNNDSRFEGFTFEGNGAVLNIEADAGGEAGNQFTIDQGASTATFSTSGDALTGAGVFSLQGGTDDGLSAGDTSVSGQVNDNIISSSSGNAASSTISFNNASDIAAGDTIQIDDGEGGFTTFTFVNGTPASANEIEIGSDLNETLQNTAQTLENFSGAGDFGTRQLDFSVDGNNLVISNELDGNATDVNGAALDINLGTTGGSISNTQLNNGSTGGVDVSNVTAAGFTGTIGGFEATFTGSDQVQLSVDIGGETFTANVSDTNSATDQTVTFTSENGGSFDVTFDGGNGEAVANQGDADTFANRVDAAFSGLEFSQTREVSSYSGSVGDLQGTSVDMTSSNFSGATIDAVNVTASGGSSLLEIQANGQTFRSEDLGSGIQAGESVTLTADNGDTITFNAGVNDIDLNGNAAASQFEDSLVDAFGINQGGGGAQFQVGSSADGTVSLSIGDLTTGNLFNGQSLDLLSLDGAQAAFGAIGQAINTLTSQRADVGGFQQALDFAAANVESAIQNQEAARAALADTDFATESTLNAQASVQQQASIATLAQTNRMQGNLLQLLVS